MSAKLSLTFVKNELNTADPYCDTGRQRNRSNQQAKSLKICFPDSAPAEKADSTDDKSKKSDTGPKRRHDIGKKDIFSWPVSH